MKKELEQLTEGEERIMQALWTLGEGSVNDVLAVLPEPKPKYTTVATFIKLLGNKGYVTHRAEGKSYIFTPAVPRDEYARKRMRTMLQSYFDGSFSRMVSFFSKHEDISLQEMDEIQDLMQEIRKKQ
ncbi:BlaI/MecI/CopY family transcriptional regulator [uncultured Alistipes sp.]|uniref:BlaI/MecI/CopY family transcriptional regulator n=1 Tax=uncultured Alistipes sp. TaxID=538949 RepID=UPI0026028F10|nr:BlaI/MecI/CopY family transcriptional regulator [uncultured Alistipes sp.]